jgi:hypothetical protein
MNVYITSATQIMITIKKKGKFWKNNGAGASFLRELRFLLPIYNPSASPQSFNPRLAQ